MYKAILAAIAAAATITGASTVLDSLQPAYEQVGANRVIQSVTEEARTLAILDGATHLEPYLATAVADIPTNDADLVELNGPTITVRAGDSCWIGTVATVADAVEIAACA